MLIVKIFIPRELFEETWYINYVQNKVQFTTFHPIVSLFYRTSFNLYLSSPTVMKSICIRAITIIVTIITINVTIIIIVTTVRVTVTKVTATSFITVTPKDLQMFYMS